MPDQCVSKEIGEVPRSLSTTEIIPSYQPATTQRVLIFPESAPPTSCNPFAFNPSNTSSPRTILTWLTAKLRSPPITKIQTTSFHFQASIYIGLASFEKAPGRRLNQSRRAPAV